MIDIPTGVYTVERFEAGSWGSDGKFSRGAKSTFQINASIQPLSGNEVKVLPEHRRNKESIMIFTDKRLFPSDEKNDIPADIVIYDGKKFEVFISKRWADLTDIEHYEVTAIMQDGEGAR